MSPSLHCLGFQTETNNFRNMSKKNHHKAPPKGNSDNNKATPPPRRFPAHSPPVQHSQNEGVANYTPQSAQNAYIGKSKARPDF